MRSARRRRRSSPGTRQRLDGSAAAHLDGRRDPQLPRPPEQHPRLGHDLRSPETAPSKTSPVAPSIEITSPSSRRRPPIDDPVADHHLGRPDDRRDAPPARDDRGVAREPPCDVSTPGRPAIPTTSSGEVSARTRITATRRRRASRRLRRHDDRPARDAGRRPQPGGDRRGRLPGVREDRGGRRGCGDPPDRLLTRQRERRVLRHLDRHPQCRLRAPLPDPDLEQPQPALLDRELDVAQSPKWRSSMSRMTPQLVGHRRHPLVEDRDRLGPVGAGDDVLALGVEQHVAVERRLAGRRVAREHDAGPESSPRLPKTIAWTVTAVPRSSGIPSCRRYAPARSLFQDRNTASIARAAGATGRPGRLDADDRPEALRANRRGSRRANAGAAGRRAPARASSRRSGRGSGSCPSSRASTPARRTGR